MVRTEPSASTISISTTRSETVCQSRPVPWQPAPMTPPAVIQGTMVMVGKVRPAAAAASVISQMLIPGSTRMV